MNWAQRFVKHLVEVEGWVDPAKGRDLPKALGCPECDMRVEIHNVTYRPNGKVEIEVDDGYTGVKLHIDELCMIVRAWEAAKNEDK